MSLAAELADLADREDFSGVVIVSEGDERQVELARGEANRADGVANQLDTRFGTASITKGFTALAVTSLIEDGTLDWQTTMAEVLGDDLEVIDRSVTVEHLLGHTSGMGDYLDEDVFTDVDDYVLDVAVHTLQGPEDFVPILARHPQREEPGSRFRYNNGAYMTLALIAERASGQPYHDLVTERVFEAAGLSSTAFLRSDEANRNTAIGYLESGRTNVFHLPVIGVGDGGAHTTAADLLRLWDALFAGEIVSTTTVERMVALRSTGADGDDYGLGFWLNHGGDSVFLEGMDAGVSGRTLRHRPSGFSYAILSNTSSGTWPIARRLHEHLEAEHGLA